MSQVDVEILRLAYTAISRTGIEAAFDFLDPEIEVIERDGEVDGEDAVGAIPVRGHAGLAEFYARYAQPFDMLRLEPFELIEAGAKIVVGLRAGGVATANGSESWTRLFHVHTMRDGRSVRLEVFLDRAAALRSAAHGYRGGRDALGPPAELEHGGVTLSPQPGEPDATSKRSQ